MKSSDINALTLSDLRYELPESSIAQYPPEERGKSRLLVFNEEIVDSTFERLADYLPQNSSLVFNNTKVINARLLFNRSTGSKIEIFCLEPVSPSEINEAFSSRKEVEWSCFVGNLKRWKSGEVLSKQVTIGDTEILVSALLVERSNSTQVVRFYWEDSRFTFSEILDALGVLPIPPYLNRSTEAVDLERYQTVYSHHKGSVAAPTAGLHFTDEMLARLVSQNHQLHYVTLHVGAGTFKPIKVEDIELHEMHGENFVVTKSLVTNLLELKGSIVAVGTTSVRTLESIYWLGVKLIRKEHHLTIGQKYPYHSDCEITKEQSLRAVIDYLELHDLESITAVTSIMIKPGYRFRVVNVLITNFHQPESTLLLLVSAFIGYKNCMRLYAHAIQNGYKFLSYGDSSLLFPTSRATL